VAEAPTAPRPTPKPHSHAPTPSEPSHIIAIEQVAGRRYGGAVDVKRAADLYAQDWTLRQIGVELGVHWSTVGQQVRLSTAQNYAVVGSRHPPGASERFPSWRVEVQVPNWKALENLTPGMLRSPGLANRSVRLVA
jgi:hypothetical protein